MKDSSFPLYENTRSVSRPLIGPPPAINNLPKNNKRQIKGCILETTHALETVQLDTRQCDIKDIKQCLLTTKRIAFGRYWVTMIFWWQTKDQIHCSLAMHNFKDKTKKCSFCRSPLFVIICLSKLNFICVYILVQQSTKYKLCWS